jgi:hypothetical protein
MGKKKEREGKGEERGDRRDRRDGRGWTFGNEGREE